MDEDLYKQIFGGAIKNIASLDELEQAQEEQRLKEEEAQAIQKAAEDKKKKDEEDKKGLLGKAGDFLKDTGTNIVAGLQQGAGKVADVAIKGGALLDEAALIGKSQEDADKQRVQNLANTEKLREGLKSLKDVKGENINGSKDDIGVNDLKDPKKVAELAAEGLDVGLSATTFANPVALARGAGGKEILKTAGKDAALFGGLDATATTARELGEGEDLGTSLVEGGKAGLLSAATVGTLDVGGGVLGKALSKGDKTAKAADVEAPKIETPEVPDSGTQFSKITDNELDKQVEAFRSGEGRTGDTNADYARYQELKDEVDFRETQKAKAEFEANGLPNDVEGAQKALDDLEAGNIPDEAKKVREANITSVAEIFADQDIPVEIRNAAQEVMDDQGKVNTMLDGLMNDQKYEQAHMDMDQAYNARLREIEQMPEPRYVAEREKLDTQYKDDLAELEMLREKDLPEVEQWNGILDKLEAREQQVVGDTNLLIQNNPDTFRVPDDAEVSALRDKLTANLEQAKQFNEPARVVEQVANAENPVKAYDRNPDAQVAMKEEVVDQIDSLPNTDVVQKNFKNISGAKLAALRIMSPSQVLEKMGLRGKDLDLHSEILKAESAVNRANKADSEVLSEIAKILPDNKQAQGQIIDYIEGKRQTLDLGDAEVATQIKSFLDEKRAGLEKLGFKTLDDYFPHIFDKNDPEVIRLFQAKNTGEISFSNLKSRLSDSEDYSRDIMDVLSTYASGYNRKVYLEPAIKPIADLPKQVELSKAEAEWVGGYVDQLMGFDSSKMGDGFNAGIDAVLNKMGFDKATGKNHYAAALGTQRMVSAAATMGLNPGTAIRNMTQVVNTVAELGPVHSTTGMMDGMRLLATKAGREELQRVGILEGGVSQNYFDAITKTGVRGRITKGRDAATKGLMSLIHVTDVSLRAQAYAGGKSLAAAKGLTGEAAENFAIRKTIDSQFITSRVDMPLAFNGQGVRSLTQLATFSAKQAGFLKRMGVKMVKGADGEGFRMKDAGAVLSAVVTAGLATEALKPLLGFRETEWVPFYDQAAPFIANTALGDALESAGIPVDGGDSLYRSPLVRLLTGDGKSKTGLIQALQSGDVEKFWEDNWSQIVPAGTQWKKSTEGYETTTTGESRNASGKLRYLQDMSQDDVLNASVFGQYSTEAGRNWISEGFPTLSDSQTQNVDKQTTREAKEQYVDFYQGLKKVSGRQDVYDEVKAAATTGDYNKAQRLAQEFNQKVYDAMSGYYQKHDELPKDLEETLQKRTLINVNRIRKNID